MTEFELVVFAMIPGLTYAVLCYAYFRVLWQKRADVNRLFRGAALAKYLQAYGPIRPDQLLSGYYDRSAYVFPVVFNMALVTLGGVAALTKAGAFSGAQPPVFALLARTPGPVLAGLAGAYVWSQYDLIRRYTLVDMSAASLHLLWLRLGVGAAVGYLAVLPFQESIQPLIAFGLGAFPLETVREFLRDVVTKNLNLQDRHTKGEEPELHKLQGLTAEVVIRLRDEGITSTQHLALANPVRLLFKTNLEWTVILDAIDQAMLYQYVGDKLASLRGLGIRSAIDLAEVLDYLDSDIEEEKHRGRLLVGQAAEILGTPVAGVENLVATVAEDPQLALIWELWSEAIVQAPSSGAAAVAPRVMKEAATETAGVFLTREGLRALLRGAGVVKDEAEVTGELLIFSTALQRTWLLATGDKVVCVLDDESTRSSKRLIQWVMDKAAASPVRARAYAKGAGLLDIGSQTGWLYSEGLFESREALEGKVGEFLRTGAGT